MTDGGLAQQVFEARWICNGFPKSGTHMLAQMVQPIAPYQGGTDARLFEKPWAGTFLDNSWSVRWAPVEHTAFKLSRVSNGHMVKAHLGYTPELERFLYLLGVIHIFIYRDLRDVAVSQAWHIINSEQKTLAHPERGQYEPLDDFGQVLAKVIAGVDRFPGVVDRWAYFADWRNVPWVLSVKYEDLLDDPKAGAARIFKHAMRQHAQRWGKRVEFDPHGLDVVTDVMSDATLQREKSPTFRRGQPGEWREVFTPEHVALWQQHDTGNWLCRLGYEQGENWNV